ncbi:unnamed protein product [Nesidiocoris tenuis]|uniref:Ubiquinone biosynthesis protein COQ4 homolog, mitochondrial n=1 Tax=Nesidiocoris tenuis TaxID=355587 RepID=A0A6H5GW19_9HEMI|nr:unnamed protein product [Nesidiocoris tenuis]
MSNILLRRISVNGANFVRFNSGALHPDFVSDFNQHHIQTSWLQKVILSVGSATVSMMDPSRGDMIATLGETTGRSALKYMKNRMEQSSEGADILSNARFETSGPIRRRRRARVCDAALPRSSRFGSRCSLHAYQYAGFVRIAIRNCYLEIRRVANGKIDFLGEVTVKWIEGLQTRLPMCLGGGIFGAVRLKPKQRQKYVTTYLPWAIKTGMTAEFMMNAYFEKRWEQPIAEFHDEFKIERLITEKAAKICEEKKI